VIFVLKTFYVRARDDELSMIFRLKTVMPAQAGIQ
jgi:hypothetical protein